MIQKRLKTWSWGMLIVTMALAPWAFGQNVSSTPPAGASAGEQIEHTFKDVAGDLRCPTCQGLSILQSTAPFSEQLKKSVREQIAEGKSKSEILSFFEQRYGPWILRAPPTSGFNILAWALPIAMILLGPPIIWLLVWRRRKTTETWGLRPLEQILNQMEQELDHLRKRAQS